MKHLTEFIAAGVILGVLYIVIQSLTGCSNYQTPLDKSDFRWSSRAEYVYVDPKGEIDQRDAKIKELEQQIENLKQSDKWSSATIKKLESSCDEGQFKDSSRYAVTVAKSPRAALRAVNEVYSNEGLETRPLDRTIHVKAIDMSEDYPDVICFKFKNGQDCFDPMEITER